MNLLNPTANLAPGFRFHPTETELITFYLNRKINGVPIEFNPISDIDLYKYSPWQLPELSTVKIRHEKQWFFFNSLDRKQDGFRKSNRATADGFWKLSGKDRPIYEEMESRKIIGTKKIFVFYVGREPNGKRTDWVMHECRCVDDAETNKDNGASFVLCRIFHKSSIGREKMDQCGACYINEEWEDAHDSGESDTNSLVDADRSDLKTDAIFMAPGFRFRPTDEELVGYYLKRKVMGLHLGVDAIPEVNIYKSAPWNLPSLTRVSLTVPNKEGYFFSILDRKYSQNNSTHNNCTTAEGYWKSTGYGCSILSHLGGKKMGMKKFLVFHTGQAPHSQRTDWVMHEYHLKEDEQNSVMCGKGSSTFVLCKIFQKKSFGEQKGRPRSVDPITEETDEGEIIFGEVLDCTPNLTTDVSPNFTTAVCTPNEAMFPPMVTEEKFAPKITQAHAAQNTELIEVVQKKIHLQASKEVQQGKAESLYKVGSRVEIAYICQQIPVAWYRATVIKVHNEQALLVEYETSKAKDNSLLSELVTIQYIRPHPPVREVKHFKVLAEVEAFYNGGWWPGVVATVHDNAKYNVKFMHLEEEIEFDHKELRLLYDWIDGKWIQASQEYKTSESLNPGELMTVGYTQLLHSNNQDHKRKLCHSSGCEIGITSEFTTTTNIENKNGKEIAIKSQHEVFQQFKKAKIKENVEDPFSEEINEELVLELGLPGFKGAKKHGDREKKDNCIPRRVESSLNVGLSRTVQENNKMLELLTSSDNSSKTQGPSNPLTSSSDASLVESSTSSIKHRFEKLPLEQPSLPFEKHSSLWDTVENMKVFHTMLQNPHFDPLGQHGEAFREGMATGLMLTFSNVVASIEKLDVTDSAEKLGLIYKTLVELEAHGFEVQCLTARLMELSNVKRNEEKLDGVSSLEDRVDLDLKIGFGGEK